MGRVVLGEIVKDAAKRFGFSCSSYGIIDRKASFYFWDYVKERGDPLQGSYQVEEWVYAHRMSAILTLRSVGKLKAQEEDAPIVECALFSKSGNNLTLNFSPQDGWYKPNSSYAVGVEAERVISAPLSEANLPMKVNAAFIAMVGPRLRAVPSGQNV